MTRAKFDTLLKAFAAGTVFQVIYVRFFVDGFIGQDEKVASS